MKGLNTIFKKKDCEYLRHQAKQKFEPLKRTWIDCGKWASPHRTTWLMAQLEGERNNHHIVDPTHILALRSYTAGFLEGNTSANRPWFRVGTGNRELDMVPQVHKWLDLLTRQTLKALTNSNFYHAAGDFYNDFGTFNTGAHFIDEVNGNLFFHTLVPGSYFILNNSFGEAIILVREFTLTVKALVDLYGKNGDWSNFSSNVRKMYEEGHYSLPVDVVQVIKENSTFDAKKPQGLMNRKWVSMTYEAACGQGTSYAFSNFSPIEDSEDKDKYLSISFSKRKPFIVGKSSTTGNFEYGQKGPTLDALGLIKSLNKKAIAKDQAIEQMLRPALQGPANLKKSYISSASNTYIPLDATAIAQKGLRSIYEINPAIGPLTQDVLDMRQQVDRIYYADYLLYLSRNPKTRTATETNAIINEQQLVIGPNLQSLNFTYNIPVVEFTMDFVLDNDPNLPPPPEELQGRFVRPEFISVFAQAQKAADLPAIERYAAMIANVGQLNPSIFAKMNVDKLADLFEDRLFIPEGLNNPTEKAEAIRQQQQAMAERQQQMEQLAQMAGAAKDVGLKVNQNGGNQ